MDARSDEWIQSRLPDAPTGQLELWMGGNNVRYACLSNFGVLMFTDCTHPLQNRMVDRREVLAWRYQPAIEQPSHEEAV